MRLLGQLACGMSQEDCTDKLDLNLLQQFYGVDGDIRHPVEGTSGAGTEEEDLSYRPILDNAMIEENELEQFTGLSEQELTTVNFIQQQLTSQQQNHVRHPPVKVPRHSSPFNSLEQELSFWKAVEEAKEDRYTPYGYGIQPSEWEDGTYPEIEAIKSGRHKRREFEIGLPNSVWFPRAVHWAQAVHIMEFCLGQAIE
jgi:hypothetical protein